MNFIATFIKSRFDSRRNDSVIVSGLHRSGKSTMMKELLGEYPYVKWQYDPNDYSHSIDWKNLWWQYQIFDRSPIIDKYISHRLKNDNEENLFKQWCIFFDSHIENFCTPMFVFYLHSIWDDGTKKSRMSTQDIQLERYLRVIQYLKSKEYCVVVCTEQNMRCYNI